MDNINISVKSNISMLILDNVPSDAGFISLVFDKFSDEAINIDMISQTPPRGKYTSIAFTFDDSELAKALGHRAFRTSVEWSRIEPAEGEFDMEAVEHYVRLFSGLKEKGIKVFITLVHFTVPYWFSKKGSFEKIENIGHFKRYAEFIVPKLAPYADFWNVLNEAFGGDDPLRNMNTVRYHAAGYHIIKKYSAAPVSSAHSFIMRMPYRPNDVFDRTLSDFIDMRDNEYLFHAVRTGELIQPGMDCIYDESVKNTMDYWAVNIYTRTMINARKKNGIGERYKHQRIKMIDKDYFYLEELYPECLMSNLTRLKDRPVYITENGCACDDDRMRIVYMIQYLTALKETMDMGVDVRGYLHWTLLDNYEWNSFKPKFGLCAVDMKTFERTPKPSAYFYKDIINNNGICQDIIRKYLKELPCLK